MNQLRYLSNGLHSDRKKLTRTAGQIRDGPSLQSGKILQNERHQNRGRIMYAMAYELLLKARKEFFHASEVEQRKELEMLLLETGQGELDADDALDMLVRNVFSLYKGRYVNFPGRSEVDAYIGRLLDPSERA